MHPPTRSMETKDPNFEALGQKNFLLLLKKGDYIKKALDLFLKKKCTGNLYYFIKFFLKLITKLKLYFLKG